MRVVRSAERLDGITGHCGRRRHLGQRAAVGPPESERPVGPARDLIALLVHRSVMSAAEKREVRERCRPAVGPVAEMMSLAIAHAAAGEPAAAITMVERPPQGGGNRPGPGSDLDHAAILVMAHPHPAGVAGQALGRFRGNARAVLEDGLARLLRLGQRLGVDVDHHLVAFARGAGIEPVLERRLRKEGQRVGLPLGQGRRFLGNVSAPILPIRHAGPLVQGLAGGGQRLHEQRADLGRQPRTIRST